MSRVDELHRDAWTNFDRPLVANRLQLPERPVGVGFGEEGQRRMMLRIAVAVRLARVLLLQPPGVRQHELAQIRRPRCAENAAAESLRHDAR